MYKIEDYYGVMHKIKPCPICGGLPERDDCGPERQAVMCWKCGTYAEFYDEIGGNNMLIEAIKIWNSGKIERIKGWKKGGTA